MSEHIDILYQDEYMVAVHKPHGLLVHASSIASDADSFALQLVRDQIRKYVYPVHRLDRKTSGVLLFALDQQAASAIGAMFRERSITKLYHAVVRGYISEKTITIDYPIKNDKGIGLDARTIISPLRRYELPVPHGQHLTSRYSLIEALPITGRTHQIRRHLAHLRHPIIGDRPHGCNKQNRLWKSHWSMNTMLLQAVKIEFWHPVTGKRTSIESSYSSEMEHVIQTILTPYDTTTTA